MKSLCGAFNCIDMPHFAKTNNKYYYGIKCARCGKEVMFEIPVDIVQEDRNKRLRINYPVGTQVICKTNIDGEQCYLAEVVDYYKYNEHSDEVLLLKEVPENIGDKVSDGVFTCGGAIKKYDEERLKSLRLLPPNDQWNVMTEWCHTL